MKSDADVFSHHQTEQRLMVDSPQPPPQSYERARVHRPGETGKHPDSRRSQECHKTFCGEPTQEASKPQRLSESREEEQKPSQHTILHWIIHLIGSCSYVQSAHLHISCRTRP